LNITTRLWPKHSNGLIKESFFKLRCKLYITKRDPVLIGDFRVPATSHSRPAGYRPAALNRSEEISGTLVPFKSFKSIQHPHDGKE
jgi:hypothetical protein